MTSSAVGGRSEEGRRACLGECEEKMSEGEGEGEGEQVGLLLYVGCLSQADCLIVRVPGMLESGTVSGILAASFLCEVLQPDKE